MGAAAVVAAMVLQYGCPDCKRLYPDQHDPDCGVLKLAGVVSAAYEVVNTYDYMSKGETPLDKAITRLGDALA